MSDFEESMDSWQDHFLRCIGSDEAESAIMAISKDTLTEACKGRLDRMSRHFNSRTPIRRPATRRRDVSTASRDTKWSSILNMTSLEHPNFVTEHFDRYERPEGYSQATAFLWDMPEPALLLYNPLEVETAGSDGINVAIPKSNGGGLLAWFKGSTQAHSADEISAIKQNIKRRVNFTYDIQRGTKVQRCRDLFTKLMWYDFLQSLFPGISGSRIGPQMQEDLRPIIKPLFSESEDAKVAEICKDIALWSQTGKRLNETLCKAFGEASLFVLQEQLSPNFIENRMTLTGPTKNTAMQHLRDIGMQTIVGRDGLQELGREIRAHLSAPFSDVLAYCRANQVAGNEARATS